MPAFTLPRVAPRTGCLSLFSEDTRMAHGKLIALSLLTATAVTWYAGTSDAACKGPGVCDLNGNNVGRVDSGGGLPSAPDYSRRVARQEMFRGLLGLGGTARPQRVLAPAMPVVPRQSRVLYCTAGQPCRVGQ